MTDVIMPQMGESIAEGTITKWFKQVGDQVERDEPLLEISTDKVDTEIPAPTTGVLSEIKVPEGETVPINTVIAVIALKEDHAKAAAPPPPAESEPEPAVDKTQPMTAIPRPAPTPPPAAASAPKPPASSEPGLRSSPLVRKMAREHGIDLAQVSGSGRGGRVTKQDVLAAIDSSEKAPRQPSRTASPSAAAPPPSAPPRPPSTPAAPPPKPPAPPTAAAAPSPKAPAAPPSSSHAGRTEVEPMTSMRKSIAEHMIVSRRTSAHVTTVFEADVSRIVQLRADHKARFESDGVKLTYTPFFVSAVLGSLKAFPLLNASIEGDSIVYHKDLNIGIAVALEGGLIVPVIKNADEKSFLGLARAVNDVGERARRKRLTPDDVQGGTFTITNPGPYGGLFGTPIINQPQVAILGLGGIHKRPVVVNEGIAVRDMIYLALSFDHRLIDGALADQFMADMKQRLENWDEKIL